MAKEEDSPNAKDSQREEPKKEGKNPNDSSSSSPSDDSDPNDSPSDDSESDSDSEIDSDASDEDEGDEEFRKAMASRKPGEALSSENTPEANFKAFAKVLDSKRAKKRQEELIDTIVEEKNAFDFPKDTENWTEEDLGELWADPVPEIRGGWDPAFAEEHEWKYVRDEMAQGRKPPIAPFYLPFRRPYPVIPTNHYDIHGPKTVIEELDRTEEFLRWVSYIFADGSSYEGTVWDDSAHGKGVYLSAEELVRYEGEWFQNNMEGHGVVEVDIPDIEPAPGSKLEKKMRAEGKIISRDFMSPEDREWLEMDIEDMYNLADGSYEIPFYENNEWVKQFGRKPEKGRYRYAGQWKHGRMHGCGVYSINERTVYGRFYFGELLDDDEDCDQETSALHAGIAEVAAAKARMFVNKPDGMVREERGPYSDPQHPYFYEEEDVWMAPGFINQFYEVPDYWKTYVHDVDQEREMWLNSFYKAPLRLPMPAELEYWWSKDENHEEPEFVIINKEPEPDPEDPSKLIYTEDPLILHTPTGHLINYVEDEKYGIRLFWQPPLKKGEDVDPEKAQFLPLGYDEFFGLEPKKESIWTRLILTVENACKAWFDKLDKWAEEQKKNSEMKLKAIEKDLELIEAELSLEEAIEDLDELLRIKEKEEEKKVEMGLPDEDDTAAVTKQDEKAPAEEEEEEEEGDEEDEDDVAQSSFGSVEKEQTTDQQKGKPGKPPFSTSSLAFASSSLISGVPSKLQQSFSLWKKVGSRPKLIPLLCTDHSSNVKTVDSVSFPPAIGQKGRLKAVGQTHGRVKARSYSGGKFLEVHALSQTLSSLLASAKSKSNLKEPRVSGGVWLHCAPESDVDSILSLHSPMYNFEEHRETK